MGSDDIIINEYFEFIFGKGFPCVAAKAALSRSQVNCLVVGHMACPADDAIILQFIYNFVENYRSSRESYHSVAVIFKEPVELSENSFDVLLWQRLEALSSLDKLNYGHDRRVDSDPSSKNYSFSLREEAFYIIGIHPASSRKARQFKYPALVFNPHAEFEKLRASNRYDKMKDIVRKRDVAYSGSINPMLADFGTASEVYQYSGVRYDSTWKCPLSK